MQSLKKRPSVILVIELLEFYEPENITKHVTETVWKMD